MQTLTHNLASKIKQTNATDEYTALHKSRLNWEAKQILHEPLIDASVETGFSRAIALGLELELPVGAFIRAVIERKEELPATAILGLIVNIKDEEKHFDAFLNMKSYLNDADLEQAKMFRKRCVQFKAHPLAKARDLESYVFLPLQGFMRMYSGQALERVIVDISHDEYRHTNYNWLLSKDLKVPRFKDFEQLCLDIVEWCFESSDIKSVWTGVTKDMQTDGYSPILESMLNYGIHKAPFEISNANY